MRRPHLTLRRQFVEPRLPRRPPLRSPADFLGSEHPFARGDQLRRDLWRQALVTAVAAGSGVSVYAAGYGWALLLLVAAASVELGVGLALVLHGGLQRERARELIIAGRGDLPLRLLERERARLQRRSRGLARALEDLVRAAERWPTLVRTCRPVFDPRLVRAAGPRLRAIAAHLRAGRASVCALARVHRLLTSGASPLYGREPEELGCELRLIEFELASADSPEPAAERLPRGG